MIGLCHRVARVTWREWCQAAPGGERGADAALAAESGVREQPPPPEVLRDGGGGRGGRSAQRPGAMKIYVRPPRSYRHAWRPNAPFGLLPLVEGAARRSRRSQERLS
ncbi:unnamed protein product [Lampetra planeri]